MTFEIATAASDNGSDVLPIIGAVTGVSAFLVSFITAVRDRPKLEVSGTANYRKVAGRWELAGLQIFVANIGRRPKTRRCFSRGR